MGFDFHAPVPKTELEHRLHKLRTALTQQDENWSMVLVHHKVSLYYLTGTMQDGVLTITPNEAILWVRRSLERAKQESALDNILPMRSYRTLVEHFSEIPQTVYLEQKHATLEWLSMVQKHLPFTQTKNITPILHTLRAEKSVYELDCMRKAGEIQQQSLEQVLPAFLREGVSEAELCGEVYLDLLRRGSMGICRYNQAIGEDVGGFCAFGENMLQPLAFDGPDGCKGTCPAVQAIGSPLRKLRQGDLVMADICAGISGYHTDKTVVYHFGKLSENPHQDIIRRAYEVCMQIEHTAASLLKPGAIPEEIYLYAQSLVPEEFRAGFMSGRPFLGHSIGLVMDEAPVLAKYFRTPMTEANVFAIEPKIALDGIGMVGTENTYLVTAQGGVSLTGSVLPLQEIVE